MLITSMLLASPFLGLSPAWAVQIRSALIDPGNGQPEQRSYEDWNANGSHDSGELSWPFVAEDPDFDRDGLGNAREMAWGTDPLNPDSDYDGIADGDEIDGLGGPVAGFNPLAWDSNSNGISDFDELYAFSGVSYSTHGPGASYYDWDGDGRKNPDDSHPLNQSLFSDWDNDGNNAAGRSFFDSDEDGVTDQADSHPYNDALSNDWNFNGLDDAAESADPDADGHIWDDSHPNDPLLWCDWDGDGNNDTPAPADFDGDGRIDSQDTHPRDASLWNDYNQNGINDSVEHRADVDSDGDSVFNLQDSHKLDPLLWNDWDFDGINAEDEIGPSPGTPISDPEKRDTDGDGLTDGEEKAYGTNPRLADTDADGVSDYHEMRGSQTASDPLNAYSLSQRNGDGNLYEDGDVWDDADSDSDGIPDLIEAIYAPALNPNDNSDASGDLDGDGISNLAEFQNGTRIDGNVELLDADYDGIHDIREDQYPMVLDKNDPADGVLDPDGDGVLNFEEVAMGLNPMDPDSYDGIAGFPGMMFGHWVPVLDSQGQAIPGRYAFTKSAEESPDMQWVRSNAHPSWRMPLSKDDADGDGMADLWEQRHRLNVRKAADAGMDLEPDGLTNLAEQRIGTNPWHTNTIAGQSDFEKLHHVQPEPDTVQGVTSVYTAGAPVTALPPNGDYENYYVHDTNSKPDQGGPGESADYRLEATLHSRHNIPAPSYIIYHEVSDFDPSDSTNTSFCSDSFETGVYPENPTDPDAEFVQQQATVRVTLDKPVPRTSKNPRVFTFHIDQAVLDQYGRPIEWYEVDSFKIEIDSGASVAEQSTGYAPQGTTRRCRFENFGGNSPASYSASVKDVAGPRYRKISLNGQPIPDSKPQVQDESGQQPEESFIDALTLQLRHSVTDVYSEAEDTLLPLSVRRDYSPECYTNISGLKYDERPDLPFGSGWRSNICSFIKIKQDWEGQVNGSEAFVSDETGAVQNYIVVNSAWQRNLDDNADAKTRYDRLQSLPSGQLELQKKFGTVCRYGIVPLKQKVGNDRVNGSSRFDYFRYARLVSVEDRWGNELVYEYADGTTLIPSRIFDPLRPDRQVWIRQQDGLVTEVRAPGGETTRYHYAAAVAVNTPASWNPNMSSYNAPVLIGVSHAVPEATNVDACIGGVIEKAANTPAESYYADLPPSSVQYRYHLTGEEDKNPPVPEQSTRPYYTHIELSGIKDEIGNAYKFVGVLDLSKQYLVVAEEGGWRTQHGQPLLMRHVTLPDNQSVTFEGGARTTRINGGVVSVTGNCIRTAVSGPAGAYGYLFNMPHVFEPYGNPQTITEKSHKTYHLAFRQLVLTTKTNPRLPPSVPQVEKSETFTFNIAASMALSSVTDMSGKTTSFYYTQSEVPTAVHNQINWTLMGDSAENRTLGGTLFDDPIVEVGPTGHFKTFTYTQAHRLLQSTTDARGVRTEYDIDALGRRTKEAVSGPFEGGRTTDYFYENATFPGFATKIASDGTDADTMPATVVLQTPDSNGRVIVKSTGSLQGEVFLEQTREETAYDRANRKRSVKDGRGLITNFGYDARGRLNLVTHPDGSTKTLVYDARGNLVEEQNENDVKTLHSYDEFNRRTGTTIDMNGNGLADASYSSMTLPTLPATEPSFDGDIHTSTTYTGLGQIHTITDPRGKTTTHTYDNLGRLLQTDDGGLVTRYGYDPDRFGGTVFDISSFKPSSVTDPRGVEARTLYNDLYQAVEKWVVGIEGKTITEYDAVGNPLVVTDPLNRSTLHEYDVDGNPVETTYADLTTVTAAYTHHKKAWRQTNELNQTTETHFDAAGRPVKVVSPPVNGVSAVSETAYDLAGNAVMTKDPLGRITLVEYDNRNRPVLTSSPPVWDAVNGAYARPTAEVEYDFLGQAVLQRDPLGNETETFYDPAGRAWKTMDALDQTALSIFDPMGNMRAITRKVTINSVLVDQTTTNEYDLHGRLEKTWDGNNILTEFEYDPAGNRTGVIDGLRQVTTFEYDELNRLEHQEYANGDDWTFHYNAVHKTGQTDAAGMLTEYGYDERSRLETVTSHDVNRTYGYDDAGRLLSVTEAGRAENNVSYTYDTLGRVWTETSRGVTHTYHYDLAGNRVLAELGTGRTISTLPDSLNRPELILESEGGIESPGSEVRTTHYGYDLAGRAVILITGNGQVTENVHDELGRLTNRTLFRRMSDRSDAGVLAEFGWLHDEVGNVRAQHEVWPGSPARAPQVRVTAMAYDLSNRLRQETVSQGTADVVTTTYGYDDANNRQSKTVTGGTGAGHWSYEYNTANQLTAWFAHDSPSAKPDKRMALAYDQNGNRTSQQQAPLVVDSNAQASLLAQGIQYQAVSAGTGGEDLTVTLEAQESGGSLGVSVTDNKHVKVSLARETAQPDSLTNQGITYATVTPHQPGREVALTLVADRPGQAESVAVSGNDVVVHLATDHGDAASVQNQGMTFTANETVDVMAANALAVRFEEGLPGEPASAEMVGNTAVVKLAMDDGLPHQLVNQGITYVTTGHHYADKDEIYVALEAASEPGQPANVDVDGYDIKVALASTQGDAATVTDQGITYTAVDPGPAGNSLQVNLQEAALGISTPSASVFGNVVTVNLVSAGDIPASLTLPSLALQAVQPGSGGNDIRIELRADFSQDYSELSVNGNVLSVSLETNGVVPGNVLSPLYPELSGGLVMQTTYVDEGGLPLSIIVDAVEDYSDLDIYQSGAELYVTLGQDGSTTVAELATALDSFGINIISGGSNNTPITEGSYVEFEPATYQIAATGDAIADLIESDCQAMALVSVVSSTSSPVSSTVSYLSGGGPGVVTTQAEILDLLDDHPQVSTLVSVSGTPSSQVMATSDRMLAGGGLNHQPSTTADDLVTLINGTQDLIVASGTGSTPLAPLALTALSGGQDPAPCSTRAELLSLLQTHLEISDILDVSGTSDSTLIEPAFVNLSGGGTGFAVTSTATDIVSRLAQHSLITATGTGTTPLSPMPRTVLAGSAPAILSTADDVVNLLASTPAVTALMSVTLTGNGQTIMAPAPTRSLGGVTTPGVPETTQNFTWTSENRLDTATDLLGRSHGYSYDYRMRRVATRTTAGGSTSHTAILFSGGLSTAEYESSFLQTTLAAPQAGLVHYVRGPDMGGGVGGLLYTLRTEGAGRKLRYNLNNGRGDIVAQSDASAELTWTASYEAYGKRTVETGTNEDKQRANSKDEDPTGLLNEGFRYRDIETGVWLSRDPAGFVDGPNLYAYVKQNPWTGFDPDGLAVETVWDIANVVHDVGRLVKNGAEMGWGAAATGYHKATGDAAAANASWNGIDGDWAEFKQAAGDTALDGGAMLVPGLPAGIQKGVRTGLAIYEKGEQAQAAINTTEKLAAGDVMGAIDEAANALPLPSKSPLASSRPKTPKKETGSYTNTHESGMTYDGKGSRKRSQDSAQRVEQETGDKHVATDWTPAETEREAFKQESRRLDSHGGAKSEQNHNKIESPGKKMRENDGDD